MTEHEKHAVSQTEPPISADGVVAHLREIDSDELVGKFPACPKSQPVRGSALFAADCSSILLTDERSSADRGRPSSSS